MSHKNEDEIANDVNYQAFLKARESGAFQALAPTMLVVFIQGEHVGSADSIEKAFELDTVKSASSDVLIQPIQDMVYRMRSPRVIR